MEQEPKIVYWPALRWVSLFRVPNSVFLALDFLGGGSDNLVAMTVVNWQQS